MPPERLQRLRREYVAGVCETLKRYILDGHEFHLRTEHDEDDGSTRSQVVFTVLAWEAFAEMLEDHLEPAHDKVERVRACCPDEGQRR